MIAADFPDVTIMYVKSDGGTGGSHQAFDKLESKLPTLKGRKFYGLVFGTPPNDEYWASVELISGDKPKEWGFQTGVIPGGKYVQERINDWNKDITVIGKTFQKLSEKHKHTVDSSRPFVEFYRSMHDMLVRLPI